MVTNWYSEQNAVATTTSSSEQTRVTLTFTPTETGNYLFIAYAMLRSSSTSVAVIGSFYVGSTQYGGCRFYDSVYNGSGHPLTCIRRLELTADTEYTATIKYCSATNGTQVSIEAARIIAIKLDGNEKYGNAYDTRTTTTGDTNWHDAATTGAFTLGTGGDYILIATATLDENSTSYSMYARVYDSDATTEHISSTREPVATACRFCFGVIRKITLDTNQHTFTVQFGTNERSQQACGIQYSNIILIPASLFPQVNYNESEGSQSPAVSQTWYTKATTTYTATADDYLLLGSMDITSDSTNNSGEGKLISTGFDTDPAQGILDTIDKDTTDAWSYLWMRRITQTAGSRTTSMQYAGGSTSADAKNCRVAALSLAAGAVTHSFTKNAKYCVMPTVTSLTKDGKYCIPHTVTSLTKDAAYEVQVTGTYSFSKNGKYCIPTTKSGLTKDGKYCIPTTVSSLTKDGKYCIPTTKSGLTKTGQYVVQAAAASVTHVRIRLGRYVIAGEADTHIIHKSLTYRIAGQGAYQLFYPAGYKWTGAGIKVGIIDTGIKSSHADFGGMNITWKDFTVTGHSDTPVDNIGHGSWTASIFFGKATSPASSDRGVFNGQAPGITDVVVCRVQSDGEGGTESGWPNTHEIEPTYKMDDAIDYCIAMGCRIINCSLGDYTDRSSWDAMAARAKAHGVIIVAADGNSYQVDSSIACISDSPDVICVGACVQAMNAAADFTSKGPHDTRTLPHVVECGVTVAGCRGDDDIGTVIDTYYQYSNGTSASAPQVAGKVAIMLEYADRYCTSHRLTLEEVRDILTSTANGIGTVPNNLTGYGSVDIDAALAEIPITRSFTKNAKYCVTTTKTGLTKDGQYVVQAAAVTYSFTKDGKYCIPTTKSGLTKDGIYRVLTTKTGLTKDGKYCIPTTKTGLTKNGVYRVLTTKTSLTKDGKYCIPTTKTGLTKNGAYYVLTTKTSLTKDGKYCIPTTKSGLTKDGIYRVATTKTGLTKNGIYRVATTKTGLTKDGIYKVLHTQTGLTKDGTYAIAGQGINTYSFTKNGKYCIPTTKTGLTKDGKYCIQTTKSGLTKNGAYSILTTKTSLTKDGKYCIPTTKTGLTKTGQYVVTSSATHSFTKTGKYCIPSTVSGLTKDGKYCIPTTKTGLTKTGQYIVLSESTHSFTRNAKYCVPHTVSSLTKDGVYRISWSQAAFDLDGNYSVQHVRSFTKDLEYSLNHVLSLSLAYDVYNPNIYYESLIGNSIITLLLTGDTTIANTESGDSTITTVLSLTTPL